MPTTQSLAVESINESAITHIDYKQALSTAHQIELNALEDYFNQQEELEVWTLRLDRQTKNRAFAGEFTDEY